MSASKRRAGEQPSQDVQAFKLAPEEYRVNLQGLELISLGLERCVMKTVPDTMDENGNRRVNVDDSEASFEARPDGSVIVSHQYVLEARIGRKIVFSLHATFRLVFQSKQEFTTEFFDIFRTLNLSVHTWPFFRELLSTMSSRTSMPTLTLPLLKER